MCDDGKTEQVQDSTVDIVAEIKAGIFDAAIRVCVMATMLSFTFVFLHNTSRVGAAAANELSADPIVESRHFASVWLGLALASLVLSLLVFSFTQGIVVRVLSVLICVFAFTASTLNWLAQFGTFM